MQRPSPRRRLPGRVTPLHSAAAGNGASDVIAELLMSGTDGPSRPTSAGNAALRRTAEPKPQQPRACRLTPKQLAERIGRLAEYEVAEREVNPARRLPPRHAPCLAPQPSPRCWYRRMCRRCSPSVLAVGARRSSGQGGDGPSSTRTLFETGPLAARLVGHCCTRGSKCRARRARAAAAIGSAKCARARSAVPRTARGGRHAFRANTLSDATR